MTRPRREREEGGREKRGERERVRGGVGWSEREGREKRKDRERVRERGDTIIILSFLEFLG